MKIAIIGCGNMGGAIARGLAAADIVVIAVKPWLIDSVAEGLRPVLTAGQTIVSVVAGVPFSHLRELFGTATLFRVIPNTAIAIGESMTVIADDGADSGQLLW